MNKEETKAATRSTEEVGKVEAEDEEEEEWRQKEREESQLQPHQLHLLDSLFARGKDRKRATCEPLLSWAACQEQQPTQVEVLRSFKPKQLRDMILNILRE